MFSPLSGQSDRHARSIHHIFDILGLTSRAARVDARHHPASRPSICRPTGDRLRVLHIAESYSAGVASALDSYIDATEHDVRHEILGFRRPGSQIGPPPAWLFVDLPAGKLRQTLAIRAKLRRTDADIIHVHSSWAGLFVRATLRRHRRPVVFSPHCYASERTTLRSGTRWLYGRVESMLAYRTDVVAAVGARERAVATRLSGRVPIVTLPHALPNELQTRLTQLSERRRPGVDVVATLGRVAPQKGVDYFCSVVAATQRQAALDSVAAPRFVWIGGGDRRLTRQLLRAGVEVTGWLDRDAATERLGDADVYLHTAAWEAGWPLSLLEAAQLKRPMICRRVSSTESLPEALVVAGPDDMARRLQLWRTCPDALRKAIDDVSCFAADEAQPDRQRHALAELYRAAEMERSLRSLRTSPLHTQILRPAASQYGVRS
jgi:glycosyltransferase involved in cell wall biosynthesis